MNDTTQAAQGYSAEDKQYAVFSHLSGFAMMITVLPIVTFVMWLAFKGKYPIASRQAAEAMNLWLTTMLAIIGSLALVFLGAFALGYSFMNTGGDRTAAGAFAFLAIFIGAVPIFLGSIWWFIMTIVGAIKVANGDVDYRFPLTWHLFK